MSGQFRKGQTPWNKGIRFVAGGRCAETQFKSGSMPHNWKPIGTERVDKDGLLQRKVADTRNKTDWKGVHVIAWESHNGPVPAGCIIVFKTSDKRNFDIENLECITRAELLKRNSVHRLPKELAQVIQLIGAVNRQINKRSSK